MPVCRRVHWSTAFKQQRDDKHSLGVVEVGDGDDRDAGLAVGREEQRTGLEWVTASPDLEAGRGEDAVESAARAPGDRFAG